MSAEWNQFVFETNSDFDEVVTWYQPGASNPPLPSDPVIDLTGFTAKMAFAVGGLVFYECTTENGGLVLGGTLGTVEIIVPHAITSTTFKPFLGNIIFDCVLISSTGAWTRFINGSALVVAGTTVS